ncbi:MAG: CpXC domain-containing protein [Anaerococcus sp.]|nr:CpXC domain-containing protein [Anaerococcus sp.]
MQKRINQFKVKCPSCEESFETKLNTAVFADSLERRDILEDKFASIICPDCGHIFRLNYNFAYTDDDIKFMIINDPKFVDLQYRLAFLSSLKLLDKTRKGEAKKFVMRMTKDLDELKEKIIIFESFLSDKAIELMKYILLESDDFALSYDDVKSFTYEDDGNFKILTKDGQVMSLGFLKDVYTRILNQYEDYFKEEESQMIDRNWAYEFLKNIEG